MMLWHAMGLCFLAGFASFLGAALGSFETVHRNWMKTELRHGIIAMGGGALMAAVSLVLVPEGMDIQPAWQGLVTFMAGAAVFMAIDAVLQKKGTAMSQLIAVMLDFAPEAIVLGSIIAGDYRSAVFLAVIMAVQNFPEGFGAYREIMQSHEQTLKRNIMIIMVAVALSGPLFALLGFYMFLPDSRGLGGLMTFCAGGIFYLVFRDVAPQARLENRWLPSFGAVIGFLIGMAGHALI